MGDMQRASELQPVARHVLGRTEFRPSFFRNGTVAYPNTTMIPRVVNENMKCSICASIISLFSSLLDQRAKIGKGICLLAFDYYSN
jgi:hypothetical protein